MPSPSPESLYEHARLVAQARFAADSDQGNADKVCAVALNIEGGEEVSFFSGAPGYGQLLESVMGAGGMDKAKAQAAITGSITTFLGSDAGGGFTPDQIRSKGFDDHGRGAMNCAEPKVWYSIAKLRGLVTANWVVVPFNRSPGGLQYNPPCLNCRRWVYGQFHGLTGMIAKSYGGPHALEF
jgi:hypothetical protein